ncbi:hypothetical protein A8L34_18540 [Bacillus sp. FJAT-27264]|uniref:hypothetical protein n=1 Tax=Paenibacillus sp. (strain DSM 101736 / FJAT-27264) TaxID=1850362 RepID=UPI000807EC1A|nr:hypothetical protein [Bacillus sp. FJAT-27264]OBZ10587.1 hypothetical protein A8L34_18540 [Bacillus sp. FJAT-27264]
MMDMLSTEPLLHTALLQFIFPFSIKQGASARLISELGKNGYTSFSLDKKELEDAYYGNEYCVSHEKMERTYLPFAAHVLFPQEDDEDSFRRFSRGNDLSCRMEMSQANVAFRVLSTDLFICPFQTGFVTLRVQIEEEKLPFSIALEFADRFRTLENVSVQDEQTVIHSGEQTFSQVEDFIFNYVAEGLKPFLDQSELNGAYFETLPFFVDERMLVQAFYGLEPEGVNDDIPLSMRYRASQLDGLDAAGRPYISASDPGYIEQYCEEHTYKRWGPQTYYMTNEQTFCCISRAERPLAIQLANQMYGEYYYGLLLSMFHKIVLLKLANMHSRLRINRDDDDIEDLIFYINKFSAKFYFLELISQSQGREIFFQLRKVYGNDALFDEVKQTLNDLFQYQVKYQSKRRDMLLMILTVFTVVSGIYGMNQVIDDLEGSIQWSKMLQYSLFQYFALVLTFSGIVISIILTVREIWNSIRSRRRKKIKYQN